jgi:hypothetical protein
MTPDQKRDRLAQCRAAHVETERRIAKLEEQRKTALLADDYDLAEVLDHELISQRLLLKRLSDKKLWLEQTAASDVPEDAAGLLSEIARCETRLIKLAAIRPVDRSALQDEQVQAIPSRVEFLRQRLELVQRMR